MKLLIVTQKVDLNDSNLGFFHNWLLRLAEKSDLTVIANEVGRYSLPANIKVESLGKEKGIRRLAKILQYQKLLKKYWPQVDGVFFHMCPEYVLAAGFWQLFYKKKSLLWYTHKSVNWRLWLSEKLVDKIFTASKESFRLASKKIEVVGHGININTFYFTNNYPETLKELRILTVGRIAPVKRLEVLINAISLLKNNFHERIRLDIVGSPILVGEADYLIKLEKIKEELGLQNEVQFYGSKEYAQLPQFYNAHNVFLHASETGSLDKVVLEALASGLQVFTSSEAYDDFGNTVHRFKKGDYQDLASKIESAFSRGKIVYNAEGAKFVQEKFDLIKLIEKIVNFYK